MALSTARRRVLLEKAALELRPVRVTYIKPDGVTETRVIEIDEIQPNKKNGSLYVRAYCRLRREVRHFTLSSIISHRTLRKSGYQAITC